MFFMVSTKVLTSTIMHCAVRGSTLPNTRKRARYSLPALKPQRAPSSAVDSQ